MLAWIGLALLSVSWLPGLGYYHGADWLTWATMIIAGTALLGARPIRMPSWRALIAALAMTLPALWIMPWPYRATPMMLAVGLAVGLAAHREQAGRWMNAAAGVFLRGGCVLLAQSLAMVSYAVATSRSHLLPSPLPRIIAAAVKALGINAGVHGTTVAVFSMRKNHLFTATWELLLDPPTWCFLIGGAILLWWTSRVDVPREGTEKRPWFGAVLKLFLLVALWLPFRAALLIAIYLDCALRTEYDAPLECMKLFWNSWVLLAMLAGPVLLAWRFASGTLRWTSASFLGETKPSRSSFLTTGNWCYPASAALAFVAVGLACLGLFWDPIGTRKDGRVFVEELQGDRPVWEPTDKPYDTERYGNNSAYTYYSVFNYYGHYYGVSRLTTPIDTEVLKKCDVLILKIPTREYTDDEVAAIVRFVKNGGGLMLIGEHTDVFGSGTYLNKVAEHFGFSYRFDCLFGVDSVFKEHYDIPLAPHPILQYMPTFDFAISCSIDPGTSGGRAVIRNWGLKRLGPDYHADNFYPRPDDSAEMQYGSFIQLLAVRYGKGRVAAFSDSTVFSDFCNFEPGKCELMMGMLEWLNHEGGSKHSRELCVGFAAVLLCIAVWLGRRWRAAWLMFAAAGLLGWAAAVFGTNAIHAHQMPRPAPLPDKTLVQFVIDRTLSDAQLSDAGFVTGKENGFGLFERWILRLNSFTVRRFENDPRYYDGNALMLICPHLPLPPGYRERLVDYVRGGGKLLVVDSADRAVVAPPIDPFAMSPGSANPPVVDTRSTAGDVLEPFGLSIDVTAPVSGELDSHGKWPAVPVNKAAVVSGGKPFAWVEGRPVAARTVFGKGSVTVVGFANRFSDANMGVSGNVVPDEALRNVFNVQFGLIGDMINDKREDNPKEKRP